MIRHFTFLTRSFLLITKTLNMQQESRKFPKYQQHHISCFIPKITKMKAASRHRPAAVEKELHSDY